MGVKSSRINHFQTPFPNGMQTNSFGHNTFPYGYNTYPSSIGAFPNGNGMDAYYKGMLDYSSDTTDYPSVTYPHGYYNESNASSFYNPFNASNDGYHVSKGFALLIFNDTFVNNSNFPFTPYDMSVLVDAFNSFNFTIEVKRNLTATEIINLINYYASSVNFSGYDCFFCVVSSHGDKSIVYGTDLKAVDINDNFLEPLYNCQTLHGKPKILVFDACRGTQTPIWKSAVVKLSDNVSSLPRIKNMKDFFIAYATLEGYVAGGAHNGSFFLQSLGYVLKHFGHTDDLNSLFTRVNADVEATGDTQIPEFYTRLKRKVYLC